MSDSESQFATQIMDAWQGKLEFNRLIGEAETLGGKQLLPLAAVLYQTWLQRNQTSFNHIALFNLGTVLFNLGDLEGAKQAYLQSSELSPSFVQPHFNLGLIYEREGKIDEAVSEWRWIDDHVLPNNLEHKSLLLLALNNLGRVLENQKLYGSSLDYLTRSLELEANQADVLHHWTYLREKQCAWPVYAPLNGVSFELMRESTSALAMLSLSDDPAQQLAAARHYVQNKLLQDAPRLAPSQPYKHRKIRVAYCSSDFCMHPVAMLTVELFELHDREQFEVYGFCWTNQGHSALRQRVIDAMDHFEQIGHLSDEAAAQLIRQHEIDILVDLHGQTLGARANMLAYRPAPVQITYLGLPATTGLPSIDYVIADRFLIPEEFTPFYSEKPLYMPDVYQISDRQRKVADIPSRSSCNLPEQGFVFCSFNNNYKYTPEVFKAWMTILGEVPGSVLWLLADNPWSEINLKNHTKGHGINSDRLIFAPRVAPEHYLARYAVADLFLDSFPFNAGTTANDALWMGLPVLTLTGRTFASRMAGALLTAAELPELITYDLDSYIDKAVMLANEPQECVRLRAHLQHVKHNGVLFDTPRFVRHLEQRFKQLLKDANLE